MLRVELIGNSGGDAEQRFTPDGKAMVSFRVAVNSVKGKGDKRTERTDWFRIQVSQRQHEYVLKAVAKGSRMYVTGNLTIGSYERDDGTRVPTYDVWADEVQSAGGRGEKADDDDREPAGNGVNTHSSAGAGSAGSRARSDDSDLQDLPF